MTNFQLKEYRKITGKISWLSQEKKRRFKFLSTLDDKENNSVTIANLRKVNKVIEKVMS